MYNMLTGYSYVDILIEPSTDFSVGSVNGVAGNTATVNLTLGGSVMISVGLQSIEYQCPIGMTYTIVAAQGENIFID